MAKHGGARPNSGPAPFYDEGPMTRTTVYLTEAMVAALKEYGDGNVSHGIRALVERYLLKTRK